MRPKAHNVRLREVITKANSQAEHFERLWYLRGDELEAAHTSEAELQADNARLREVMQIFADLYFKEAINALAATPKQSLARHDNRIKEECAKLCKDIGRSAHGDGRDDSEAFDCADAILATKEPE